MKNFIFCLILFAGNLSAQTKQENTAFVSIIELLANPTKFHNANIGFAGVFDYNEGQPLIYLSKDDKYYRNTKNGFILEFDPKYFSSISDLAIYDGNYVEVIGSFNKDLQQYYFSGTIEEITSFTSKDDLITELKYIEIEKRKEKSKTKPR
ncbi:hypothetical protein ABH942_002221 [Flavobacterium sp. 28YEA47A]|uniref:hypothetical protein n=1 Tax=Flavobacterium sp. 28YEA47A TaxID=3156276 RepID=UPI003515156F